jgi:ATP-dependent DNA helicase 2 subunit 1
VKRGTKSESADEPPSKRPKVEPSSSGVEEEVKKSFDKGAVSKVGIDIVPLLRKELTVM